MLSMKASTASIWASSSRSCRLREHRPRLHQVLVDPGELVAALDERRGRAAEHAVELRHDRALRDRRDRPQRRDERHAREVERARDERGRRDRQLAGPRTGRAAPGCRRGTTRRAAPAGRRRPRTTARTASGITSSIQCSSPSARSLNRNRPVVDEVRRAARARAGARPREQPRRRSKHSAGAASGGTSSTGRGVTRRAPRRRQVAVHPPQRPLVDQRRRHRAPVGEPAAHVASTRFAAAPTASAGLGRLGIESR